MFAMFLSMVLAIVVKPTDKVADHQEKFNLETMIPKQFGDWVVDNGLESLLVSPDKRLLVNKIYNQTLSRTYVRKDGQRVMLSIAYGSDQSDSMQVHKPETCYTAQGFQVVKQIDIALNVNGNSVKAKQLVAVKGDRIEPITYWIRVGNETVLGNLSQKIAQLKYTLTGYIPDGLLFRVSSIQSDELQAYDIHKMFIDDLFRVLDKDDQIKLNGTKHM
jgi:EpsI family protein